MVSLNKKQLTIIAIAAFIIFDVGAYFIIKNTIEGHARTATTSYADRHSGLEITYDKVTSYPLTKTVSFSDVKLVIDGKVSVTATEVDLEQFKSPEKGPFSAAILDADDLVIASMNGAVIGTISEMTVEAPAWGLETTPRLQAFSKLTLTGVVMNNGYELSEETYGGWQATGGPDLGPTDNPLSILLPGSLIPLLQQPQP